MVVQDRNPFRPGWNLRLDWHGEIRKRPHFWCIGAEPAGTPRVAPTRGIWPRTVVFPLAQVSGTSSPNTKRERTSPTASDTPGTTHHDPDPDPTPRRRYPIANRSRGRNRTGPNANVDYLVAAL